MELTIHWTDFSKAELKNIFKYYAENVNERVAEKVVDEISDIYPIFLKHIQKLDKKNHI
jgi:plasmid stabilization system protein ParE